MLVKTLKRAGIDFLIGIAIANFIVFFMSLVSPNKLLWVSETLINIAETKYWTFLLQSLILGMDGMIISLGIGLYDIPSCNYIFSAVIHVILVISVLIPCAHLLDLITNLYDAMITALIITLLYFFISCARYVIYRQQVKRLNELQNNIMA